MHLDLDPGCFLQAKPGRSTFCLCGAHRPAEGASLGFSLGFSKCVPSSEHVICTPLSLVYAMALLSPSSPVEIPPLLPPSWDFWAPSSLPRPGWEHSISLNLLTNMALLGKLSLPKVWRAKQGSLSSIVAQDSGRQVETHSHGI